MATESDCWSCPDPTSQHQDPQDVPISDILDHGSISFGRFAVESLAWEKRSVFSHNRCKEELEKFRAPGLVAEKKAYFEEYYRKIRAMKALQVEQQQTSQPESCQDMQNDTLQVENGVDAAISKDEIKISNVRQIRISDNGAPTQLNSSEEGTLSKLVDSEEQQSHGIGNNSKASRSDASLALPAIDPKLSIHEVSSASSVRPISESSAKWSKEHSTAVKAKGTIASNRDKGKSDCGTMETAVKPFVKQKTPSNKEITVKTNNGSVSRKINLKAGTNMKPNSVPANRQRTKVCQVTNVLRTMANSKLVLSSPSVRGGQVKTKPSSKNLDKLSTRLPVQDRPVQSSSRPNSVNSSSTNKTLDGKRGCNGVVKKPSGVNGHHVRPKGGEYKNQKPVTVMSSRLPGQDKLKQNTGVEVGHGNHIEARKQNERKGQVSELAIGPTGTSSLSSVHKASTTKRVHKVTPTHSADTTHDRRAPRHTMPSWR